MTGSYETNVFINCPLDAAFQPIFDALVFCVFECGFRPRCALEADDSGVVRFEKILSIIQECRLGLHDLSRTELDATTGLPRFNMPLELGVFLAAKRFGTGRQKSKICLVLDRERYRYQSFISDIAGQDIRFHGGGPERAIREVRDWLRAASPSGSLPGGVEVTRRYRLFRRAMPKLCRELKIGVSEVSFVDLTHVIERWLAANS